MSHALILQHLKGATSQNPVTLEQLVEKTGLLPDTVNMILDHMQNAVPATINKVKVIKNGSSQILVWPTGASQPASWRDFRVSNGTSPPSKRDEVEAGQQNDPPQNLPKVSNLDVVKYVSAHPGITSVQVTDHFASNNKAARNRLGVMLCTAVKRGYLNKIGKTLSVGPNVPKEKSKRHPDKAPVKADIKPKQQPKEPKMDDIPRFSQTPTATHEPCTIRPSIRVSISKSDHSDAPTDQPQNTVHHPFTFNLPAAEAANLQANIRFLQAALDDLTDEDCLRVIVRLGNEEIGARLKSLAELTRREMEEEA